MPRIALALALFLATYVSGATAVLASAPPTDPPPAEDPEDTPAAPSLLVAEAASGGQTPTTTTVAPRTEPICWWDPINANNADYQAQVNFWEILDGGAEADNVVVFLKGGNLYRTINSTRRTTVWSTYVCDPADAPGAGAKNWIESGPPDPTAFWPALYDRVVKKVPPPAPNLGYELDDNGVANIVVRLGLWVAVDNPDDVVAHAEAGDVWAKTTATLTSIEYLSGTGGTSGVCTGAGTPLPADDIDTVEQGPCGYTYTHVDELGEHTAVLRATWTVVNTASTGASERRPDIVLDTEIPIDVTEIVTVGVANR